MYLCHYTHMCIYAHTYAHRRMYADIHMCPETSILRIPLLPFSQEKHTSDCIINADKTSFQYYFHCLIPSATCYIIRYTHVIAC